MTVVIKSYRFDLPPPAFTESNYDKGHWDIIHTLEADLVNYPEFHEMLGIEMIISDRIYDGDNITFEAKYYNKDTGAHIFTSSQSVPDPGDYGYEYWNSYRICSWIGSCHWEISGPMDIRIVVTVKKGVVPIGLEDITMVVTESEPTATHTLTVHTIPTYCYVDLDGVQNVLSGQQGFVEFPDTLEGWHTIIVSKEGLEPRTVNVNLLEDISITVNISAAPDFWTDPLGWIQFYVIATIEQLLGWTAGTFEMHMRNTKSFLDNFSTAVTDFFSDVSGTIVQVVKDNLLNILIWQSVQLINFFDWITALTTTNFEALKTFLGDVSDFVGSAFTGFVDWLNTLGGTVAEYISSQLEGFLIWGDQLLADIWEGIEQWVIDLIEGFIASYNTGFDQGIENQKNERNEEE